MAIGGGDGSFWGDCIGPCLLGQKPACKRSENGKNDALRPVTKTPASGRHGHPASFVRQRSLAESHQQTNNELEAWLE